MTTSGSAPFDLVVLGDAVVGGSIQKNSFVAVHDGRIAEVGQGDPPPAQAVADHRGKLLLPGIIDGQVHAGSQEGHAGIAPATHAAAAGGVTTIVDMPFDEPLPLQDPDILAAKVAVIERQAKTDVALYGTLAKHGSAAMIADLAAGGVCAFKFSAYEANPVRFPRIAPPLLLEALQEIKKTGLAAGLHNEDQETVDHAVAHFRAAGRTGADIYEQSRPVDAEMLATAMWMEMGAQTGARVHIVHSSVPRGFELGRAYRAMGVEATVEMVVHYLLFSDEDVRAQGGKLKVGPPIRPLPIRDLLWDQFANGNVLFVSSDHGPWPIERKTLPDMFANAPGIPGLETLLPSFLTAAGRHDMDFCTAVRLLTEAPARFFGIGQQKGKIAVGADADIAVVSETSWKFDAAQGHTHTRWSPLDGAEFDYRVDATYLRGRPIFDGEKVSAVSGQGQFVRPASNMAAAAKR